jgi:hypothetical protein
MCLSQSLKMSFLTLQSRSFTGGLGTLLRNWRWHGLMPATAFPASVRNVLKTAPEYAHAEFIDAFFEREVELGTPGRNSQTDLMVVAGLGKELGIIAVEGKVEESFVDAVSEWNTSPGKHARLERLCATVGVHLEDASDLR